MTDFFLDLFNSISHFAFGLLDSAISSLLALFPDSISQKLSESIDFISPYSSVLNYWLPIDFGLILLSAYLSIYLAIFTIKMVIKLIPFIG